MAIPLVSIIINNFNYERYLARSIESALGQTYPRIEVVIVDDVSTDGSRDIISRYVDRTVQVLHQENAGQGAAVNSGFRASHGEIVFFLDADDYLYPHAVAQVVSRWEHGLSKVQFRLDLVDVNGHTIDLFPTADVAFDSGDVVPQLLTTGRYQTTVMSGNAFSREVLAKILPMPEADFRIAADGYLVTVTPFYGPVASIEEPLGAYRQHGDNAWNLGSSALTDGELAERLRRTLEHDALKYKTLELRARLFGMKPAPEAGLRDTQHLAARLGSLCLDPAQHGHPRDSRPMLGLRGAVASGSMALPWRRQATLVSWFLAVGLLPRPVASRAAAWYLAPGSRPPFFSRLFRKTRPSQPAHP